MAVLAVMLGISVLIERWGSPCFLGSISAYYYTPVHSVFVGALIAIGVTLVALKGRDDLEDILFNLAGALAPVVALVPTARPSSDSCASRVQLLGLDTNGEDVAAMTTNNVSALLGAGALALVVAAGLAWWTMRKNNRKMSLPDRVTKIGLGAAVLLFVAGLVWFVGWRSNFDRRAHGAAAIAMFVFIWIAVVVNGGRPKAVVDFLYRAVGASPPVPDDRWRAFPPRYQAVAALMFVGGAVALALGGEQRVFWLEVVEIIGFALFWLGQTHQYWSVGAPVPQPDTTPAARLS